MNRTSIALGSCAMLLCGSAMAQSQYPILDKVAAKLVQKYQTSSCDQLAQERKNPPTGPKEAVIQNAGDMMQKDAKMRAAFVSQVAAPIADKMIACGFIP